MNMKLIDLGLFSAAKCYCIVKQILHLLQKMICVYTIFKNCILQQSFFILKLFLVKQYLGYGRE